MPFTINNTQEHSTALYKIQRHRLINASINHVSATSILLPAVTNPKPESKHNLYPNSDPDHIIFPEHTPYPNPSEITLWLNTVCGGLERLLVYEPGFNSQRWPWIKIMSTYALRLISRTD